MPLLLFVPACVRVRVYACMRVNISTMLVLNGGLSVTRRTASSCDNDRRRLLELLGAHSEQQRREAEPPPRLLLRSFVSLSSRTQPRSTPALSRIT